MESIALLLAELHAEGFETAQFENKLKERIDLGIIPFRLTCKKRFGEELMHYTLVIDRGKDASYHLTELTAAYRDVVELEDKVFKGISILQLDQEMAQVDWDNYFYGSDKSGDPIARALTGSIISRLRQLDSLKDADAVFNQQQLMFKHWPAAAFEMCRISGARDRAIVHECTHEYRAADGDTLNANLAFFNTSGRIASLVYTLEQVGLEAIIGTSLQDKIQGELRGNPDTFVLKGASNDRWCYAEFSIPITKIKGWYSVAAYQMTVTPYPEIPHGVYNGIDTSKPEAEMKLISGKGGMALDEPGQYVAGLLQLKHMKVNALSRQSMEQNVCDLLDRLPKIQREFPVGIKLQCGINLLLGRSVLEDLGKFPDRERNQWISLDLNDKKNGYPQRKITGSTLGELENMVAGLAPGNRNTWQTARDLTEGNLAEMMVKNNQKILITAHPETRTIHLFTPDLRPIPFNINFDPDWKPPALEQKKSETLKTETQKKPARSPQKNQCKNQRKRGL